MTKLHFSPKGRPLGTSVVLWDDHDALVEKLRRRAQGYSGEFNELLVTAACVIAKYRGMAPRLEETE